MESVVSVLLGLLIAWLILSFTSVGRSNYANTKLLPENIESSDNQNTALVGTGLASRPSVMDATPASNAQPVMMGSMNMSPISVTPPPPRQAAMPMQTGAGQMPMQTGAGQMPMQTGATQMPMQTGATQMQMPVGAH